MPAFFPLASKIIISNSSPLQGRRANRLPLLFYELFIVEALLEMDDLGLPPFQENSIWIIGVESTKKMGSSGYFTNKIWQVLGDAAALYLPLDIPQLLHFHCDPP